jgi:hypothetical protein
MDTHDMGPSRFIPRIEGEHWYDRHARRAELNNDNVEIVANWCSKYCICFEGGVLGAPLWHFYADDKHAVFNPWDASLVLGGNKRDSFHVHDYKVLLQTICRYYSVPQPTPFELANFQVKKKKR